MSTPLKFLQEESSDDESDDQIGIENERPRRPEIREHEFRGRESLTTDVSNSIHRADFQLSKQTKSKELKDQHIDVPETNNVHETRHQKTLVPGVKWKDNISKIHTSENHSNHSNGTSETITQKTKEEGNSKLPMITGKGIPSRIQNEKMLAKQPESKQIESIKNATEAPERLGRTRYDLNPLDAGTVLLESKNKSSQTPSPCRRQQKRSCATSKERATNIDDVVIFQEDMKAKYIGSNLGNLNRRETRETRKNSGNQSTEEMSNSKHPSPNLDTGEHIRTKVDKVIEKTKHMIQEHKLDKKLANLRNRLDNEAANVRSRMKDLDNRYKVRENAKNVFDKARKESVKRAQELKEIVSNGMEAISGTDDTQKQRAEALKGQFTNMTSEVVRRVRQAQGFRRTIVRRVESVKSRLRDVLTSEIYEGVSEAFEIVKGDNELERQIDLPTAIPALLAPMFIAFLQNNFSATLYFLVPECILTLIFLILDAQRPCRYDIELYFSFRLALNIIYIFCLLHLRQKLTTWYEKNGNKWEASLESASELFAGQVDIKSPDVISTISTGLATLMFYDKLKGKCSFVLMFWYLTPFLLFYNFLVLYLAFEWGCADCNKDLLQVWMVLMACLYLVTFIFQAAAGTIWLILICLKCNPFCKSCLVKFTGYMDEGLPHPITTWIVLHTLLRPNSYTILRRANIKSHKEKKRLENEKRALEKKLRSLNAKLDRINFSSGRSHPPKKKSMWPWMAMPKGEREAVTQTNSIASEGKPQIPDLHAAAREAKGFVNELLGGGHGKNEDVSNTMPVTEESHPSAARSSGPSTTANPLFRASNEQ